MNYENLSEEQKLFIKYGTAGHNILVEACIGSGKLRQFRLCAIKLQEKIFYT